MSALVLLLFSVTNHSVQYGNTGFGVLKWLYKIKKIFVKDSTYPKEIIEFWING